MKHLLSILVFAITLFTALQAVDASANDRFGFNRPGRPGPGWGRPGGNPGWGRPGGNPGWSQPRVTCSATDNGWEEHWGGHGSCQECKAKHGSCTETCSTESFACRAEGSNSMGNTESFEAYGSDEMFTRNEALDRCYRMGNRNCRSVGCTTSSQVVSRRGC